VGSNSALQSHAHRPRVLFADEPTGNLHDTLSRQVMDLMVKLVADSACSLLLVTHNREMASFTDRQLLLEEGHLHELA
jgi:putative ABC transport system ATP-binding protein